MIIRAIASRSKAIAALVVVVVAEALAFGVLPESWRGYAQVVVAVAAYFGVYQAPKNAPTQAEIDDSFAGFWDDLGALKDKFKPPPPPRG